MINASLTATASDRNGEADPTKPAKQLRQQHRNIEI